MKKCLSFIVTVFVLVVLNILGVYLIINQEPDLSKIQDSLVYIEAISENSVSHGSGFVYKIEANKNYIITCYHIIENSEEILVYNDKHSVKGIVLGYDQYSDIAVITIDDKLNLDKVKIGDSSQMKVGNQIYVAGSPLNKKYINTITSGIVSYVDREISFSTTQGNSSISTIQVDAPINPGNSGSALLNSKGEVIGLIFIKEADLNNIGFAIPINFVSSVVEKIMY